MQDQHNFSELAAFVRVADAGSFTTARCLQILADLDEAQALVTRTAASPRGRLRIQLPVGLGSSVVLPALPQFLARYPDLSVDVDLSDRAIDLAEEGMDAVLRVGPLTDSRLVARRLASMCYLTVARPTICAGTACRSRPTIWTATIAWPM